ncbi:unnamed protein product [Arabis nemorensis]|uniref:Uncharacterized protein n=1 Tax=Arabis nemorensis TaxID=586526 RepID=A0A565CA29_9BRAS|nr:unnamed protein product [Arabis nemorensis]
MEESSERRPVRLGEYKIPELINMSMVDDDMKIISIKPHEDCAKNYQRMIVDMNQEYLRLRREIYEFFFAENLIGTSQRSYMILPPRYSSDVVFDLQGEEDLILLLGGVSERPRPTLRKARRTRDLPSRVSRRSSQVSPPIYLRHRFLPQSRKGSSTRRQR